MSITRPHNPPTGVAIRSPHWSGPALLLVLSGIVALIFQVTWIKQVALIVGVDVYAVSICVSSFFTGLALGGIALGRFADRLRRPLQFYGLLEIGIALSGVGTTLLLSSSAQIFVHLERYGAPVAWGYLFTLLSVPPFLMGGTVPAVVRSLTLEQTQIGHGGGWMYAANTTGGILGALLCSFYFIPEFGIRGTAVVAAIIGVCAALGAWILGRSQKPLTIGSDQKRVSATSAPTSSAALAIALYSVAGGIALGYEVVWSQSVVQFMSTRSFAFSVMLATYLSGLAIGSAIFGRFSDRVRNHWALFGALVASAGMVALLEIAALGSWLPELQRLAEESTILITDEKTVAMCARFLVAATIIVFVPTVLLGAAFPAALKLIVDPSHVGRDLGRTLAFNTIGGIVGSLVTGFVLVPYCGLVGALGLLALCAAAIGILAALRGGPEAWVLRLVTIGISCTTVIAVLCTPPDRLATLLATRHGGDLVYYREGRGGTVAVLEQHAGTKAFRRLYIQGVSNSGDAMTSLRYMRLQALLPLIIHNGNPTAALVVGFGTGITAGALSRVPGLTQRVVAELLPEVIEASSAFKGNFDAQADSHLEKRLRDGRREMLSNSQTYDLITLEPPPPSAAGVVNLYSTDFYRLARSRLNPAGIVAQWLPLPTQTDQNTRSLVRSFLEVFPHASVWTTEIHEMMLIGSIEPLTLDVPKIIERFSEPEVATALREVGIPSPEALLATWISDRAGLEAYAGTALAVTDDNPRIEYAEWVHPDEIQRTLPHFMQIRTDPPLVGADLEFQHAVATERQRLSLFYQAALNGMLGYRDLWEQDMRRVLEGSQDNAYYNWFIGETT